MWTYQGREITEVPEGYIGFIYFVQSKSTGKYYVGKKLFNSTTRSKIGKREKAATKTRKTYKVTIKDSGWQNYASSCKELQDDVKLFGRDAFYWNILELCANKTQLNYKEVWWQFKHNVLEANTYNGNIAGKYFKQKEK